MKCPKCGGSGCVKEMRDDEGPEFWCSNCNVLFDYTGKFALIHPKVGFNFDRTKEVVVVSCLLFLARFVRGRDGSEYIDIRSNTPRGRRPRT